MFLPQLVPVVDVVALFMIIVEEVAIGKIMIIILYFLIASSVDDWAKFGFYLQMQQLIILENLPVCQIVLVAINPLRFIYFLLWFIQLNVLDLTYFK